MSFASKFSSGLSQLKSFAAIPPPGVNNPASSGAAGKGAPPGRGGGTGGATAGGSPLRPAGGAGAGHGGVPRNLGDLDLRGGRTHTDPIVATVNGDPLGAAADAGLVVLSWFRVRDGAHFSPLAGVTGGAYTPCIDDCGSRVLCRARDAANADNAGFGEVGPIEADAALLAKAARFVDRGEGYFVVDAVVVAAAPAVPLHGDGGGGEGG